MAVKQLKLTTYDHSLRKHRSEKHSPDALKCSECPFTTRSTIYGLRKHFMVKHSGLEPPRKCSECSYRAWQPSQLQSHMMFKHRAKYEQEAALKKISEGIKKEFQKELIQGLVEEYGLHELEAKEEQTPMEEEEEEELILEPEVNLETLSDAGQAEEDAEGEVLGEVEQAQMVLLPDAEYEEQENTDLHDEEVLRGCPVCGDPFEDEVALGDHLVSSHI